MDVSENTGAVSLYKRKRNKDGTVSITIARQPEKKKTVIARGKGKHTVGNVIISQIEPFKNHMKCALQKRGFNVVGLPFKEIVPLYYNEFVANRENQKSKFVPVNSFEFRNNPVWKIDLSDNLNGSFLDYRNSLYVSSVNDIVNNIINIFSDAKAKKEIAVLSGIEPYKMLTDEEMSQAKAAEKVIDNLENKLNDTVAVNWSDVKQILKIAFFVWLTWYLMTEL